MPRMRIILQATMCKVMQTQTHLYGIITNNSAGIKIKYKLHVPIKIHPQIKQLIL